VEYSSLSLQEVKECEGGCKVIKDNSGDGKGPEGGFSFSEEGMERSCSE
jgi:hypothetical protein